MGGELASQSKSSDVSMVRRAATLGQWALIAALSVAMLTLYVDNHRIVSCIQGYATKDQQNTIQRSIVADQERSAFLVTLTTITNPAETPQARKKSIDDYIALVQKNDQVRKNNPPLQVPTECS